MPKILSINEMTYKTLTTKITKTPKYKEVLEALGYVLIDDHEWSHYDYWGIALKEDNGVLVISQGYDKKKRLYKTAHSVDTKDITKVDFVNLINTDRSATRAWNRREPESKIAKYKRAKRDYEVHLSICESKKKEIAILEEQLVKAKENLESWEKMAENTKVKLDEAIAAIKGKEFE